MNAEVTHWQTILSDGEGHPPSLEEILEFFRDLENWYAGIQPGVTGVKHD